MSLQHSNELRLLRQRVDALEEELRGRLRDEGGGGGSEAIGLYMHSASTSSMKLATFIEPVVPGGAVTIVPSSTILSVNFLNMAPSPAPTTGSSMVGVRIAGAFYALWYGRF